MMKAQQKTIKLSSPWVTYFRQIEALFSEDENVRVELDEECKTPEVKIYVVGNKKAEAIEKLIPAERVFGNVVVRTTVIPERIDNIVETEDADQLLREAFEGNPALSRVESIRDVFIDKVDYFVFKKKVVQFFNDDLSDVDGKASTLYQDLANEVFGFKPGIFFCTDSADPDPIDKK